MSGDTDGNSPEDDSGRRRYEGEFSGDLRGGKFAFRIPREWIHTAAPAMLVIAYILGLAFAIFIVCFGISLIIK